MNPLRKAALRSKYAKEILREYNEKYDADISGKKIEKAVLDNQSLYLIDGKPLILIVDGVMVPTLVNTEMLKRIPTITVDMGAVPYICNGADIMIPGIRNASLPIESEVTVVIVDERHHKPIAVGITILELKDLQEKGKAIKNLHYVGDKIWKKLMA